MYFYVHEGDNLSDHCPIVLDIKLNVEYFSSIPRSFIKKPSWKTATANDILAYTKCLVMILSKIHIPKNH